MTAARVSIRLRRASSVAVRSNFPTPVSFCCRKIGLLGERKCFPFKTVKSRRKSPAARHEACLLRPQPGFNNLRRSAFGPLISQLAPHALRPDCDRTGGSGTLTPRKQNAWSPVCSNLRKPAESVIFGQAPSARKIRGRAARRRTGLCLCQFRGETFGLHPFSSPSRSGVSPTESGNPKSTRPCPQTEARASASGLNPHHVPHLQLPEEWLLQRVTGRVQGGAEAPASTLRATTFENSPANVAASVATFAISVAACRSRNNSPASVWTSRRCASHVALARGGLSPGRPLQKGAACHPELEGLLNRESALRSIEALQRTCPGKIFCLDRDGRIEPTPLPGLRQRRRLLPPGAAIRTSGGRITGPFGPPLQVSAGYLGQDFRIGWG